MRMWISLLNKLWLHNLKRRLIFALHHLLKNLRINLLSLISQLQLIRSKSQWYLFNQPQFNLNLFHPAETPYHKLFNQKDLQSFQLKKSIHPRQHSFLIKFNQLLCNLNPKFNREERWPPQLLISFHSQRLLDSNRQQSQWIIRVAGQETDLGTCKPHTILIALRSSRRKNLGFLGGLDVDKVLPRITNARFESN